MNIIVILFMFSVPLILLGLEKRVKIIAWLSPVIICYIAGLCLGNVSFLNLDKGLSTSISEAMVPLSIPLLLLSSNIMKWFRGAKSSVISFLLCIVSVFISSSIAAILFKDTLNETWKLSGMMIGVYTGGTPNMSAIGLSLEVTDETFILLNASDLIMGSIYLLFLMTIAKPILGYFLPSYVNNAISEEAFKEKSFDAIPLMKKIKLVIYHIIIACMILGISLGISFLLFNSLKAIPIILLVTSLGICLSFNKTINNLNGSYETGNYFLLVFCIAIGSMADISTLLSNVSDTLYFTGLVMFGAISIHFLFAYFFKIDRDTTIITSVAGIYGPAFVGPIAKVLDNRSIVLSGMTTGLVGYALGNYLGIGFAKLLQIFL